VDDLGKLDAGAWDSFVDEVLQRPGVRLLAAVRSEDLGLVGTIGKAEIVLPTLEETLAERIHSEFLREAKTGWEHWREPFEKSEGLLLEYTHILTRGARLSETIRGQIDQRLRDERDLELKVLRLGACAHIWGGEASVRRIADRLDVEDEELQRALRRLLEEHLLREGAGDVVVGLHELRSREIVRWTHNVPPPTLDETAAAAAAVVSERTLQPFLVNLYMSDDVETQGVIEEVLNRLTTDLTADVLVAALQALRLVGFFNLADVWISILEAEQVPVAKRLASANFSLLETTDLDLFVEPIQRAVPRLIAAEAFDPRTELIERLAPNFLENLVTTLNDCHQMAAIFAALNGTPINESLRAALAQPNISVDESDVDGLGQMIANARSLSLELSKALVERLGGEEALLSRLSDRPWVREIVVKKEQGERVVSAKYRFLIPRVQPDPHEEVVSLCRNILHLLPETEVAAVTAIDAMGEPAGFGDFRVADKRIRRKHLPPLGEIAWNRARMRIIGPVGLHG
jgi:DNA-binding transcriptional ArsR family regulator